MSPHPEESTAPTTATPNGVRGRARERDVKRVAGGRQPTEVDKKAQILVSVRSGLPGSQGGRYVLRDLPALPLGVLSGHAAELAGSGHIGHRGTVPAGIDALHAGHGQELIDHQSFSVGG
jgi:hypothetical protein